MLPGLHSLWSKKGPRAPEGAKAHSKETPKAAKVYPKGTRREKNVSMAPEWSPKGPLGLHLSPRPQNGAKKYPEKPKINKELTESWPTAKQFAHPTRPYNYTLTPPQ